MFRAAVDPLFAIGAREAFGTRTSVRPLSGVVARAVVLTRSVVSAEVQVLIAEESSPAFVAEALPFLLTRAVHAPRITLALVAQPSNPAGVTSAKEKRSRLINCNSCSVRQRRYDL